MTQENFLEKVKEIYLEWESNKACSEAVKLNEVIGEEYFDTANPHFFTGDLNSKIVLVHLNPKRDKNQWSDKCKFNSFEEYLDKFSNFGKYHYGEDSPRSHKSPFDHKQIRFLKPLDVIPLDSNDKFKNLENVIDNKLQIELIPYGSPNFDYNKVGVENLKPFVDRFISLVAERPREYVIFCGRIFEHILADKIISKEEFEFKLTKNDGNLTMHNYHIINIKLKTSNGDITACIAPQFAKQGYPVEKYGIKVKELYGSFK